MTVWAPLRLAPILKPRIWGGTALTIGAPNRISLMAGNPGSGPDTLCYVDDGFLDPKTDRIVAVLHAKNKRGGLVAIPLAMQAPC